MVRVGVTDVDIVGVAVRVWVNVAEGVYVAVADSVGVLVLVGLVVEVGL